MNWILAILGILGLYLVLGYWTNIHHSVAFSAFGMSVTWFAILFIVGSFLILRATVFGK